MHANNTAVIVGKIPHESKVEESTESGLCAKCRDRVAKGQKVYCNPEMVQPESGKRCLSCGADVENGDRDF